MMEPFRSHPRSQTAIFLAGCILSCLLQLVPAQENLIVVSVPERPFLGQDILLKAQNIPEEFIECNWTTPTGSISFTHNSRSLMSYQTLILHQNCFLSILNLRQEGKYTVRVTAPPAKQQEARDLDNYIGSITIPICEQTRIKVEPRRPRVGQNVILTPEGVPKNHDFCEWKQKTPTGFTKYQDPNGLNNQQSNIKPGCSLHLTPITLAEFGNYTVYVQAFLDQNSGKEGKGTRRQMKCYRSQTQLNVGNGVLSPFFPEC